MSIGKLAIGVLIIWTILITIDSRNQRGGNTKLSHRVLVQQKTILQLQVDNKELEQKVDNLEETLREVRVVSATITAYSPRTQETDSDPFITASMQPVKEGSVAVSRDLFYDGWVFGRQVYIEGKGVFVITDLMHERKQQQIDIFMFNTKKALKFGRQQRRVALLD